MWLSRCRPPPHFGSPPLCLSGDRMPGRPSFAVWHSHSLCLCALDIRLPPHPLPTPPLHFLYIKGPLMPIYVKCLACVWHRAGVQICSPRRLCPILQLGHVATIYSRFSGPVPNLNDSILFKKGNILNVYSHGISFLEQRCTRGRCRAEVCGGPRNACVRPPQPSPGKHLRPFPLSPLGSARALEGSLGGCVSVQGTKHLAPRAVTSHTVACGKIFAFRSVFWSPVPVDSD